MVPLTHAPSARTFLAAVVIAAPLAGQGTLHVVRADSANERFGRAVSGGHDLDGDGHPDVVIGAYADSTGAPEQGSIRVVSGWTGNEVFARYGAGKDWLGFSVAISADMDGDGRADVIAGAPQSTLGGNPPGYARAFSGATGAILWTRTGPNAYSDFGNAVCAVGDVDGDGRGDVAVGARYTNGVGSDSGAVYVYSGDDGALLRTFAGAAANHWYGWSVAGAGDVNGDGCPDLAIGVVGWDEPGLNDCGALELRSLCTGALIRRIPGIDATEAVGWSVAGGGDLDGDGVFDVLAGVPGGDFDGIWLSGGVRAYSGANGALLRSFAGAASHSFCGEACAIVGDTDGDGTPDVAVGSPGQPAASPCGGTAELYSGASGARLRTVCGEAFEDGLGAALAPAGDVNADGFDDWIVGAPNHDSFAANAGIAYVVSGFDCPSPTTYCVGLPNSVGAGARIGWSGSASLSWGRLTLACTGLPPGSNGRFFFGSSPTQTLFGDGYRCASGPLVRLPIQAIDASGSVALDFDAGALPLGGRVTAGDVRYFQFWYRNQLPGGAGFNLSDGLRVEMCP